MEEEITLSKEQESTFNLINNTNINVFIQGQAGTGKSYFIKYLKEHCKKDMIFLAPTAIAAMNIDGSTIHSFFMLPPSDFITDEDLKKADKYRFKMNSIIKYTDIIVIDEVSMIRPDMLDSIDILLRKAKNNFNDPFGGIQMVLIGDLYQLPPVISNEAKHLFLETYETSDPYFFDSLAYKESTFFKIEFKTVFRQSDPTLLTNLSKIRMNKATSTTLDYFNKCKITNKTDLSNAVTITPYRNVTEKINKEKLKALPGTVNTYKAKLIGSFETANKNNMPVPEELELKDGALIIFNKNSDLWCNGSLGIIKKCYKKYVKVTLLSNNLDVEVFPEVWESYKYDINKKTKEITKTKTGEFRQLPLQLGYALTIHKCVHENTLVNIKNKGLIPIKNVIVNDEIQTGFGDYQKITYKSLPEIKKTLRITTNFGYSLDCSPDHPLLVNRNNKNEWITADKLQLNDILCISRENLYNIGNDNLKQIDCNDKLNVKLPMKLNEDLSYLLGYLIGNGSQNDLTDCRIDITIPVTNIFNYIKKTINSFNLDLKVRKKVKAKNKDDMFNYFCYVCSKKFRLFLLENGLTTTTAYFKHIPECIFKASGKNKAMFIRGLMDADGSVALNGIIRYVSMSTRLLNELQLILSTLGIGSCIKENTLHILKNDNKKFCDEIGFLYQKKLKRLTDYLKNKKYFKTNIDNNLIARDIVTRALPLLKEKFKDSRGKKGEGFAKYNKSMIHILFRKSECELNNDHLKYLRYILNNENILDFNEEIDKNLKLNYLYDKIKSINIQEDSIMYDISVENHSAFIGNGIICHNCQGKTLDKVNIDMSWGAFAHGQLYVALSRTRNKEDMNIQTPLKLKDIIISDRIVEYMKDIK